MNAVREPQALQVLRERTELRRRPIARLFDLADKLKEIRGYNRLLEKFRLGPPLAD